MIESYIYLYHIDKEFKIPVVPDSISDSTTVSFSPTTIPLSSAPLQTFSSSGPRTVPITLSIHRSLFELDNPSYSTQTGIDKTKAQQNISKLDEMIKAISALAAPNYVDSSKLVVPPSIMYRAANEICIRGVVSSNISLVSSGAWTRDGKLSIVQINFTITEVQPYSASYILQKGGLRGISTDLRRSSVWQF